MTALSTFASIATGAVTAGSHLFIATVQTTPAGNLLLQPQQTEVFELCERDGLAVKDCAEQLSSFIQRNAIKSLVLRYSPDTGQYRPHPNSIKLETILQLIPDLDVDMVVNNSVTAWIRREQPCLPVSSHPIFQRAARGAGHKAVEVATYAAFKDIDPIAGEVARGVGR